MHTKYMSSLELPQLSKKEVKDLAKRVLVLTCAPNLAPTYLFNVISLYTKASLESLSRQIQAFSFPYESRVFDKKAQSWKESCSTKMQTVLDLLQAKMDAMRALHLSPGPKYVLFTVAAQFLSLAV